MAKRFINLLSEVTSSSPQERADLARELARASKNDSRAPATSLRMLVNNMESLQIQRKFKALQKSNFFAVELTLAKDDTMLLGVTVLQDEKDFDENFDRDLLKNFTQAVSKLNLELAFTQISVNGER